MVINNDVKFAVYDAAITSMTKLRQSEMTMEARLSSSFILRPENAFIDRKKSYVKVSVDPLGLNNLNKILVNTKVKINNIHRFVLNGIAKFQNLDGVDVVLTEIRWQVCSYI